jgi:transcriptional regulator with XRE-family HTH domain
VPFYYIVYKTAVDAEFPGDRSLGLSGAEESNLYFDDKLVIPMHGRNIANVLYLVNSFFTMKKDSLELPQLIKKFRRERGLSQRGFGDKLGGYKQGYIADLERGRQNPSREFYKRLSEVFGPSSHHIIYKSVSYQWDQIEEILMSEGIPGQVVDKLQTHILAALVLNEEHHYKAERSLALVHEPAEAYELLSLSSQKTIDKVKKILKSENDTVINALKANIEAFLMAMKAKKPETGEGA